MKIFHLLVALLFSVGPVQAQTLPDRVRFSIVIELGDVAAAREWLDAGLPPDFEGNVIGTGLMIGAWEGNIPMMELFLSRGADINKANSSGEQALLLAAWKGQLAAVRWLVERGASLNRQGKQWAALHYAAFGGHTEVVAYLLERGADINALSSNGSTPLMMAAREGRESIARTLLGAGARRDIVNEYGDDAMRWAMRNNNLKIAQEIAGQEKFAAAAAQPKASWGQPVRSQPVPDRADMMLAQARVGGDPPGGGGCGQACRCPPNHRNGDHREARQARRADCRPELRHAGRRHRGGESSRRDAPRWRRRYGERPGGLGSARRRHSPRPFTGTSLSEVPAPPET